MRRVRAPDDDRARFPDLEADVGEDPARVLDGADKALVLARIRGIDYLDVLDAWLAVERRLFDGRSAVIEALESRREELEVDGERDLSGVDLEAIRARHRAEAAAEPDPVWRHVPCGSTDVDRESSRTWYCNECELRTNRVERLDEEVLVA